MTAELDLTVAGSPVPKGRARISTRGGFARAFTPAKTRAAEDTMAGRVLAMLGTMGVAGWPAHGALSVRLWFTVAVPPSWPRWRQVAALSGAHRPVGKPDVDNYMKLTKDALNGVLWVDDSQIVDVTASKHFGVEPSTRIVVTPVAHQTAKGAT